METVMYNINTIFIGNHYLAMKGGKRWMSRKNQILRGFSFFFVLVVAIICVDSVFGIDRSRNRRNWVGLQQQEKKGSMDAVFIGASNVLEFWQPSFGWADHGIAVWNLSMPGLTCAAFKNTIIEARKTQPDALYIISLSTFKGSGLTLDIMHMHSALNYMPFSLNKLKMTYDLIARSEFKGLDALEFYLPIIRFHSRWDDLKSWVFDTGDLSTKLSITTRKYYQGVRNIENKLVFDNEVREPIPADIGEVFEELLDYCDAEHLNVLFVKSPQKVNLKNQGHMNELEDILDARGYPCLDLMENFYEIGLDPRTDYQNAGHTNIHGGLKFCKAIGDYLVDHYGFEDKRGLAGWESWDEACETYNASCELYTLPFEREHAPRFYSDIPTVKKPVVSGMSVKLTWTGIDEADGYAVFRKSNKRESGKSWAWIADADAGSNEYTDNDLKASTQYTYAVVPYRQSGGTREYGSFDVLGVSATTGGK